MKQLLKQSRLYLLLVSTLVCSAVVHANELTRNTATRVHRAFEYQQSDQQTQAIELLESIKSPKAYDNAYVARMLGVLYWQQGMTEKAEAALTQAVQSDALAIEQAIETEQMLADIQLSIGKAKSALSHYHTVLGVNQDKSILSNEAVIAIHLRITQANYQLQNWPEVLTSLERYHQLEPATDVTTLNMKLGAQLALEKWNQAIVTTKALQELRPNEQVWWQQLTSLYLRNTQYQNALANLKQMQRKGFELAQADYVTMAQLYAQQSAPELAARVYFLYINNVASSAENLAQEASYWQQAKVWEKSLDAWKKASALHPKHRWSYIQLLMRDKQFELALAELNKVTETQATALLATQAYYQLGDIESAKISAAKAHKIAPDNQTLSWIKFLAN